MNNTYFEPYNGSNNELISIIEDKYLNEIMKNFVAIKYISLIRNSIKKFFKLDNIEKIDYSKYYDMILTVNKNILNKILIMITLKSKEEDSYFNLSIICLVDALNIEKSHINIHSLKEDDKYTDWEKYGTFFKRNVYDKLKEMWKFDYETYFKPIN